MKTAYTTALAALAGLAAAAKEEGTFSVLRFTNKQLTKGRMDPIVSPGQVSTHTHNIMGGSAFGLSSTGEDLMNSKCTNAMIAGDNSNYWFPSLYFKDPESGSLESVEVSYVNAYYFFEESNDDIKAFPVGLSMMSGDPNTRSPPEGGPKSNFDPEQGPIQAIKWTCPRKDNVYDPPSWPADSDGTTAGIGDPVNLGEGVGFPSVHCDGLYSPLRADVHFPSCYNPEVDLMDNKNNMAWPTDTGNGKKDCPEGYIHVPHLFLEVYWDTPAFKDRWDSKSGNGPQPFILSNGDATGYSLHADFMAGWDEELLQHIIDTCDTGFHGMDTCAGLFYGLNDEDCTIPSEVDEKVSGVLSSLPGANVLTGWAYGLDGLIDDVTDVVTGGDEEEEDTSVPAPAPTSSAEEDLVLPEATEPVTNVVENPVEAPEPTEAAEQEDDSVPTPAPEPTTTSCERKVKTVWETVTVTATVEEEALATAAAASNSTGPVAGYQYAGCFKDGQERALSALTRPDIGAVTNENCVQHCKEAGFLLAGTQWGGECYCGNELVGSEQLDESACDMPCNGDGADICGGDWALSVFSESGEASISSAKVRRHLHNHHAHGHRRSFH